MLHNNNRCFFKVIFAIGEYSKTLLKALEQEWMASRKIVNLSGIIFKETQIRKLRGILKSKNVLLVIENDIKAVTNLFKPIGGFKTAEDLFLYMRTQRPPFVGMFHAETRQLVLIRYCTEIVAFHELAHLKHYELLGEAYKTISKLEKEMYVWRQIISQRARWTTKELEDTLRYINDIRTNPKYKYNLEPIKIN
jgi:Metallopeptidase toxin 4